MAFTTVARSATPVTLLLTSAPRTAAIISNSDAGVLYLLIAGNGVVSATYYSVSVAAGTSFTVPSGLAREKITGLWAGAGSGVALITTDA